MKAPAKATSRMMAMKEVKGWPARQHNSKRPRRVYSTPMPEIPSTARVHVGMFVLRLVRVARKYEYRARTTAQQQNSTPRLNHWSTLRAKPDFAPMMASD